MHASWLSRKGNERAKNSDAAAVAQQGQRVLAVLVDGAEKGPRGAELARHWADTVLQALTEPSARLPSALNARLKQEQVRLRHGFLGDIASYCMVSLDQQTLVAQVWHCGDCCVGLRHKACTQWLTTPHILSQQPGIPPADTGKAHARHKQQLTRCLNAKRFRTPEYRSLKLEQGQTLWLCTDGYWREHLEAETSWDFLRDDASLLTLPIELGSLEPIAQASDANNLNDVRNT